MTNGIRYILGIQSFANQDSGAAIVQFDEGGQILDYVAISEERLIRQKYPYSFPVHSIGYCMDHFGLDSLEDIDLLVTDYIREKRWFFSGPAYRISKFDYLKLKFDIPVEKIVTISHHMAHAASAYYTSGYDRSAILIVDGNGSDLETTSFLLGDASGIRYLDSYKGFGIGSMYEAVTSWILNMGQGGEGKTMGLAPFGEQFEPVLNFETQLDGIRNDFSDFMYRIPASDILNFTRPEFRTSPLKIDHRVCAENDSVLDPYFARAAYDAQCETERVLTHLGKELYKQAPEQNLCLAGGVALNSVANKIMFDNTEFENIHVFPACSDSGIPFGLALWGYYNHRGFRKYPKKRLHFNNAYTGRDYASAEILEPLEKYQIAHSPVSVLKVAELISEGNIVAWFQGGSEYGPRALGHRSILADSRRREMCDIVNLRVKHRETYRPFAPAILLEHCAEYFEIDSKSPFMLLVADVKKPDVVPAVTHVDNTARVQTVTEKDNGKFYELVKAFGEITGVPCIMNTSFNDAGEPIVETPTDALLCFLKTDMDYLVLDDVLIDAKKVKSSEVFDELIQKMTTDRQNTISRRQVDLVNRFCPGFDEEEMEKLLTSYNEMSEWHALYRNKYELEKKVLEWKKREARIMLVGTKDHTCYLLDAINDFSRLNVVGFIDFNGKNDIHTSGPEEPAIQKHEWEDLCSTNFDEILIASHEYQFEIERALKNEKISKPIVSIYDSSTRNMMLTLGNLARFPV